MDQAKSELISRYLVEISVVNTQLIMVFHSMNKILMKRLCSEFIGEHFDYDVQSLGKSVRIQPSQASLLIAHYSHNKNTKFLGYIL